MSSRGGGRSLGSAGKQRRQRRRWLARAASWDDLEQQVEAWRQRGQQVGVLAPRRPTALPDNVTWLRLTGGIREQARALYRRLREADHLGLQVLVAVMPADAGPGHARRDRLRRAAGLGDEADTVTQPLQISGSDA